MKNIFSQKDPHGISPGFRFCQKQEALRRESLVGTPLQKKSPDKDGIGHYKKQPEKYGCQQRKEEKETDGHICGADPCHTGQQRDEQCPGSDGIYDLRKDAPRPSKDGILSLRGLKLFLTEFF